MKRDIIIGIDAGTSVIKSVAFTLEGKQLDSFALPNVWTSVEGAGAEQDLARTWSDTAATLRGLATLIPGLEQRTAAIAVTGQGDGTWLIDADGEPTFPAMLWLDARAASISEELRASPRGRAVFERTGAGVNPCQQSSQLLWLKRHHPDVLARTTTAFHCKDWLYFNLTGERAGDPSESVFTFGNIQTRKLDANVIVAFGLEAEARLLPPIVDGVKQAGRLGERAAHEIGFPAGLPVVLGYVDVVCTALGGGLYDRRESTGCTVIGSTGMHMRFCRSVEDVRFNDACTGYTMTFPVGGGYAQMQSNMASTINIDWLLDLARGVLTDFNVAISRKDLLAGLDARVLAAEPGTLLFHPYISEAGERGPFVDSAARAQFMGLSTRHGFSDLLRGVIEGLAFAARDCYEAMGPIPKEVRVSGGAARSKAIRTILGSALNADIRTSSRQEAGAAGAAMMAAVSLGLYPDMESCTDAWVTPLLEAKTPPDPALVATYDRLFPAYRLAREASVPVWHALRDIRTKGSA